MPSPQTTPYNTITKQQSSGGAEQARTNIRQWQPQEQPQQQGEQLAGPHRYGTRGVIRFLKNRIYPVFRAKLFRKSDLMLKKCRFALRKYENHPFLAISAIFGNSVLSQPTIRHISSPIDATAAMRCRIITFARDSWYTDGRTTHRREEETSHRPRRSAARRYK